VRDDKVKQRGLTNPYIAEAATSDPVDGEHEILRGIPNTKIAWAGELFRETLPTNDTLTHTALILVAKSVAHQPNRRQFFRRDSNIPASRRESRTRTGTALLSFA
jgi:hypothetical protein